METEKVREKFQTELKWASYYFIYSIVLSFAFAFFSIIIFNQSDTFNSIIIVLNFLVLIYCSLKCIQEKKVLKDISFFLAPISILNIFTIYCLFNSLLFYSSVPFIIPKRELEIHETNENVNDVKGNLLNDFITFIKTKLSVNEKLN